MGGADTQTLIAYSIALLTMISVLMVVLWARGNRATAYLWLAGAFMLGSLSGAMVVAVDLLPAYWGWRIGATLVLIAYGCLWQAIRSLYDRPPLLGAVLVPPLVWVVLSDAVLTPAGLFVLGATIRSAIIVFFMSAAAWELWRARDEDLPSRKVLFWLLVVYCVLAVSRLLTTTVLSVPTPDTSLSWWLVAAFNWLGVCQALLICLFTITLQHERTARSNYRLALIDPLTGLANRRAYEEFLAGQAADPRAGETVAVMFVDIDNFKQVNDAYGHEIGDRILKAAADNLRSILGPYHRAFRIGGDEFVCILRGAHPNEAIAMADRLRTAFQFTVSGIDNFQGAATLSIGVAASEHAVVTPGLLSSLLGEADGALRRSKNTGRNRTLLAARRGCAPAENAPVLGMGK